MACDYSLDVCSFSSFVQLFLSPIHDFGWIPEIIWKRFELTQHILKIEDKNNLGLERSLPNSWTRRILVTWGTKTDGKAQIFGCFIWKLASVSSVALWNIWNGQDFWSIHYFVHRFQYFDVSEQFRIDAARNTWWWEIEI